MLLIVGALGPAMEAIIQACGSMLTAMAYLMKRATTTRQKTKVRLYLETQLNMRLFIQYGKFMVYGTVISRITGTLIKTQIFNETHMCS